MKLGLIETLGAWDGRLPLWDRHMLRMSASAERLGIPFHPPPDLKERGLDLLSDLEHEVLRITLQPGDGEPEWFFDSRPRAASTGSVALAVASEPLPEDDVPRDMKVWPRAFYDAVLVEAKEAEAEDAVILDSEGAVLETAVGNLFWWRDGVWHTPEADGRLLPGIARDVILEGLHDRGEPVHEGRYGLAEMAGAEVVVVTNAVYGPRPASVLKDATVRDLGPLSAIWRAAIACG